MNLTLVTPPTPPIVTLDEMKEHLRVTGTANDAEIDAMTAAAMNHLDGRAGWLGRALLTQVWDLHLTGFPAGCQSIALPFPPLQSVASVSYTDEDGAAQTLEQAKYTAVTGVEPGMVQLAYDELWPSTRMHGYPVTVRFTAGYGARGDVPEAIRSAIKLIVADWFDNRGDTNVGNIVNEMPNGAAALLSAYRMVFV